MRTIQRDELTTLLQGKPIKIKDLSIRLDPSITIHDVGSIITTLAVMERSKSVEPVVRTLKDYNKKELTSIPYECLLKESAKAYLLSIKGHQVWVPKSQSQIDFVDEDIIVPKWFYDEKIKPLKEVKI